MYLHVYQAVVPTQTRASTINSMNKRPPLQCYHCQGPHRANEFPHKSRANQPVNCYKCQRPHYLRDCPFKEDKSTQPTVPSNAPLCSGCGVDHLYKECPMRMASIANDAKAASLKVLSIERGQVSMVSLNAITRLQAKALDQMLQRQSKRDKASTSGTKEQGKQKSIRTTRSTRKIKNGKGQVIIESRSDEDTATLPSSASFGSSFILKDTPSNLPRNAEVPIEARATTPKGQGEYPHPLVEM